MTLRNRLARIGVCLALILTLGAWVAATAAPVAAHPALCDPILAQNDHRGINEDWGNSDMFAVRALIDPREISFRVCSHGSPYQGGTSPDAVSAWIMLQPGAGANNGDNYVQLGIVRCNFGTSGTGSADPSYCDTNGNDDGTEIHFFLARYGCGYGQIVTNLGDADFYEHEYVLEVYNGTLYAKIGDSVPGDQGDWDVVFSTNVEQSERLTCWLDNGENVMAKWSCETHDGGDLCAHEDDKLNFRGIQTRWPAVGSWHDNQSSTMTDPCTFIDDTDRLDSRCDVVNSQDFTVWQNHK